MKIKFKSIIYIVLIVLTCVFFSCNTKTEDQSGNINTTLSVEEFDASLKEKNVQLVDVRTPGEYAGGHLKDALNYDIGSADFETSLAKLDKNKPVMVYCLSGGRSAEAAEFLSDHGFKKVYNMGGGIMKWSAAGKPLDTEASANLLSGMNIDEFNRQLSTGKYVLVDYNAKWCKPCVKMMPMLKAFTDLREEKVTLISIDADKNKDLMSDKGISSIPYLELYKDGKLLWKHEGEIDEATLLKETNLLEK